MSMAAWPSMDPASPLSACWRAASMSRDRTKSRKATAIKHDHDRAADELGQGELPGEQQRQDDAQFDDQVGAGDLEGHRGGEAGTAAEQGAGQRHRGVGARRGRGTQAGGHDQRPGPVVAEQPDDRVARGSRAWTTADRVKPRISDQVICQVIDPASARAWPSASRARITGPPPGPRSSATAAGSVRAADAGTRRTAGRRPSGRPCGSSPARPGAASSARRTPGPR